MNPERIPLTEAADLLGCDPQFLRVALQQGRFSEIGFAAKRRRWAYYINRRKLYQFIGREELGKAPSRGYRPTKEIKKPLKPPPPLFGGNYRKINY